jgi:ribosome maturation factor RimP
MSVESNRDRAQRGPGVGRDAIRRLLEPVVGAAGFDLEDVTVQPAGRRRLVKVVVDADGGISLDGVATVSQAVSGALDGSDLMGAAPYVLEVTSPGVDRPLTEPRHWRRAAGRLIRAGLAEGGEIEGRVLTADDEAVVIETAGTERRIAFGEIGQGRVQVEFSRAGETQDQAVEDVDEDEGGASWTST